MQRILMIEDDTRLAVMVRDYLQGAGYDVTVAGNGAEGLAGLRRTPADVILLDLMLPDGDGLDVFRRIRELPGEAGAAPVIMLTARGDPMDRVVGLELGADDYVPKPFEPRELLARVRAVLRRGASGSARSQTLRFGRLEIDPDARSARLDGADLTLTAHQFALLLALAERPGRVLSREQLMELARGGGQAYDPAFDRSIDVHIARIRAAIEDDPGSPRRILTVRGAGYVFARAQD